MGGRILTFLMVASCLVVSGCGDGESSTAGSTRTSQPVVTPRTAQDAQGAVSRTGAVAVGSDVNTYTLKSAQVPADCGLPAQRLQNNQTTKGSPGSGSLVDTVAYADFAGLGYEQALTAYVCTAGGVSWPQDLVLIGDRGRLLASVNLGSWVSSEHSALTSIAVSGSTAKITWETYEGAGSDYVHQSATVSYDHGKFVMRNHVATYTPEAVVSDILSAQFEKQRSSLKDPTVVTNAQWQQLTTQYADFAFTMNGDSGTCTTVESTATCSFKGVATGSPLVAGTMTLQKAPSSHYGWQVTNLQLSG